MSIETDANSDLALLKAKIAQLEAEAESVWQHYETYVIIVGALFVGAVIGHFLR
jgi:hypothetical protein